MSEGLMLEPPKGRLKKADPTALSDLVQQYDQALIDNGAKTASFEESKVNYLNLHQRLKTLPDKLEYAAMLPLGNRALCPGRIIHTNEIMCQLGDNWFVETSSKTAATIVSNRLKKCDEMLANLKKEEELYKSWRDEANRQKIEALNEGSIDIEEEYDEEHEKLWKVIHRENLRQHHQKLAKEKNENSEHTKSDADIWTRLDELELEEELEEAGMSLNELLLHDNVLEITDEKKTLNPTADHIYNKSSKNTVNSIKSAPISNTNKVLLHDKPNRARGKKVTFSSSNTIHDLENGVEAQKRALQLMFPYMNQNNDVVDSLTMNTAPSSVEINEPLVIHFKHSQLFVSYSQPHQSELDAEEYNSSNQLVVSPGDIYKYFSHRGQESSQQSPKEKELPPTKALKSILKPSHHSLSSSSSSAINEDNFGHNGLTTQSFTSKPQNAVPAKNKPRPQKVGIQEVVPFTSVKDIVIERHQNSPVVNSVNRGNLPSRDERVERGVKPVSLFKQARSMK